MNLRDIEKRGLEAALEGMPGRDLVAATTDFGQAHADGFMIGQVGQALPFRPGNLPVNPQLALSLTAVWGSVARIRNPLSIFPVHVYKETSSGRERVANHRVDKLFNCRANKFMTGRTMRQSGSTAALLWGAGHVEIQRNTLGQPVALWPLLPWATFPEKVQTQSGDIDLRFRTSVEGQSFSIPHSDVLHIMDVSFDGIHGLSPIMQAAHSVGLSFAAEEFGGKFFTNDAKSGGFVMVPGRLSSKGRNNITDSIAEQGGLDNAHRVKVLEEGAKFINTTIPPEAAQFLGTREFQVAEIARMYNVPLHMLQSETGSTSWGSGLEQLARGFVQYTLQPWVNAWETEINEKLFTKAERDRGLRAEFNLDELLRGDSAARAALYSSALDKRWMTVNEVRALEGLGPIEGGDKIAEPQPAPAITAPASDDDSGEETE